MKSLVAVTRSLDHARGGVVLHRDACGYLTLYCALNHSFVEGPAPNEDVVVITVRSDDEEDAQLRLYPMSNEPLVQNLYVDRTQSILGEAARPNKWIVWGVCTPTPLPA